MKYNVFRLRKSFLIICAFLCICTLLSFALLGKNKAVAVSSGKRQLPIYSVETDEKKVALGFNCAWENTDIPQLIEILDKYNIKASFFVSGSWCNKFPESVKVLADAGHEIGSHSNTHADMAKLSREEILEQITRCNEKILRITGTEAKLFRMPSGSYNDLVIETIRSQGMEAIQWSCDSIDYLDPSPEEMKQRIMSKLENGAIMLFHSGAKNTPEALPGIIEAIKAQDYEIVIISDLIYPSPYTIDHEGRQHKANIQ